MPSRASARDGDGECERDSAGDAARESVWKSFPLDCSFDLRPCAGGGMGFSGELDLARLAAVLLW